MRFEEILGLIDTEKFDDALKEIKLALEKRTEDFNYWKRCILFLFDNYQYFEVDYWDELLESGMLICKTSYSKAYLEKNHSFFYLYEYKFTIEYIKYKPYNSHKYPDEYLQKLLDNAIQLDDENSKALEERGRFFYANSKYDLANSDYTKVINLQKNINVFLYLDKANNNEIAKNYNEAIADNEIVLNNTDVDIIKSISYSSLIRIYKLLNNNEKAKYYENLLDNLNL